MKAREVKELPTSAGILSILSSDEIFERYLGGIPNKAIISPLRNDKVPSFSLFRHDNGQLFYKDFATGEVGDCFHFVRKLLKYNRLVDVFTRIASDFMLSEFETRSVEPTKYTFLPAPRKEIKKKKTYVEIKVRRRPWKDIDVRYWKKKYGFSRAQLEFCGVYPISHFFVGDVTYIADKKAYAYVETKDGKHTYKIYQPYSRNKKWINNNDFSTWELWTQLPARGRRLIITSSRKDAMMIKSLFPSKIITSCALQSEGTRPKVQVVAELKSRFRDIYILYDNDFENPNNPGRATGKKLSDEFGIPQIEIPDIYKNKDISDLANKHGRGIAETLVRRLVKESDAIKQKGRPF